MALTISRILHAGYIFKTGSTQIAFDPLFENPFSRNCFAFPEVRFDLTEVRKLKLSAVFISHYHDDHCSFDSLNLLDRATPIYMYCLHEEMFLLLAELGFQNVFPLVINRPVSIAEFTVTPRRALDADIDCLLQVEAAGLNILNVVDSWIDDEIVDLLAAQKPWDLILWPFQTMRELEVLTPSKAKPAPHGLPPEWPRQLRMLNPRVIVPSSCQFIHESWSWYNKTLFPISYRNFAQEVLHLLPETKCVRLDPSVSITLDSENVSYTEPLTWVHPVGPQEVDYDFDARLIAPPMRELALQFRNLTGNERKILQDYCDYDLPEKFKTLSPSMDPYFDKARTWRLEIYDHTGEMKVRDYRIQKGELHKIGEGPKTLSG